MYFSYIFWPIKLIQFMLINNNSTYFINIKVTLYTDISHSTTLVTAGPVGAFLVLLLLMLCVMAMAFVTFKQCHKKSNESYGHHE